MTLPLYDHWPIRDRAGFSWPDGKSLAVYVGLNIESFEAGRPATSIIPVTANLPVDPANQSWREYGTRVGIWRMVDLLDEVGMRASVLLNSDVCARYPEIVRAGVERDWRWVAHGVTNSRLWTGLEPDAERRALAGIFETIAEATGRAPQGWLGPALTETANTPALLSELGARYLLDWSCDDQPFPLNVDPGPMISVPYSAEVNDMAVFVDKCMSGPEFEQLLLDQFEVLYEESRSRPGAVMGIAVHPFVVNLPFRHKYLARALRRIVSHDDVWLTTTDDICDWYFEHEYERAVAALVGARA